jgi:hypothetical protein
MSARDRACAPLIVQTMLVVSAWFECTRWLLWLRGGAKEHLLAPMLRAGR